MLECRERKWAWHSAATDCLFLAQEWKSIWIDEFRLERAMERQKNWDANQRTRMSSCYPPSRSITVISMKLNYSIVSEKLLQIHSPNLSIKLKVDVGNISRSWWWNVFRLLRWNSKIIYYPSYRKAGNWTKLCERRKWRKLNETI